MTENRVTLVSCFYFLKKSKHPIKDYISWISNFLLTVTQPLLLFTDETTYPLLSSIGQFSSNPSLRILKKPLDALRFSSPEWKATWELHARTSRFAHLHSQELFRIWANKPYFIEEAIRMNPFHSETFVWCDMGCWRDTRITDMFCPEWPVESKITGKGRMHVLTSVSLQYHLNQIALRPTWTLEEMAEMVVASEQHDNCISGTIFAGDIEAWKTWTPLFERVLNFFIEKQIFAGDDQHIHSAIALWLFYTAPPDKKPVLYVCPEADNYINLNGVMCGSTWFFFQFVFSKYAIPTRIYTITDSGAVEIVPL